MTIQDWGVTYDEMEKYYDKYEKMAGISGEEDPLGPERSNPYPNPPMKDSPSTKLFKKRQRNLAIIHTKFHRPTLPSSTPIRMEKRLMRACTVPFVKRTGVTSALNRTRSSRCLRLPENRQL